MATAPDGVSAGPSSQAAGPSSQTKAKDDSTALGDLLRLGRPHFLLGGVAFVVLGIALAWRTGATVDPMDAALAQALVTLTQWGVHYGNEAHDVAADRANARRTRLAGGSGLIVKGRVSEREARFVSAGLFGVAVAIAATFALRDAASLLLSVPLLVLSWAYSAPPLRLCARGLGELATGFIVAVLAPALILLPANVAFASWLPLAPLAVQVAVVVVVLSLPDVDGDAASGKRTLAVRLGPRRTRRLVQVAWIACGLASTVSILEGAPTAFALAGGAAFAAAVALPLFVLQRSWDALALVALGLVALQWGLTMAWAIV